jgi:hypothetical protein
MVGTDDFGESCINGFLRSEATRLSSTATEALSPDPAAKITPVVPPRKTPNPSGASGSKHRFVDSQDKPHARPRHIGRVCDRQKMHCRILDLGNGERIFLAPWGDNLTENSPNNTLKADVNPSGRHADKELANSERIETGKSGEIKMKPLILGQGN